ncbi:hypothetical protein [Paraburkholderia humisilvae]|uniref:Peptidase M41 domain-containing protein n=1 Tax=Paraburkholderia humisilvae TaxID=627669 RepID=A0A6J5DMM6_9BURK|nr:hypothetical protein [Paraburkholderia humisilvae]CAB3754452.1 hypothetical protein LMG29542_02356 [Paraburkholderia humisilvae]
MSNLVEQNSLLAPRWRELALRVACDATTWLAVAAVVLVLLPHATLQGTLTLDLCADIVAVGLLWIGLTQLLRPNGRRVLLRGLALAVTVLLLRLGAPDISALLSAVSTSPQAAIPALAAVAVVGWVECLVGKRRLVPAIEEGAMQPYIQSPEDMRRVAIHEAGHTLLYRLLPERPSDMRVLVRRVITDRNPRGGEVLLTPMQVPVTYAYVAMLIALAGLEAEFAVLESRANGGADDYAEWMELATRFAVAGSAGAFYRFPATFWQRQINRDTINALEERQRSDLREFFTSNRDVLVELADNILARGELDHEQIASYLDRVDVHSLAFRIPS